MNNPKEFVISVNPDNNKVTMFVKALGVSFEVGTQAEINVLTDTEIDATHPDLRGRISLITRMCKNPTFAPTVANMPRHAIAFDYSDFMNMITINYAQQVNNHYPTVQ